MNRLYFLCGFFLLSFQVSAGDLFENDQVQIITLTGPLNTLIRNKEDEKAYPFVIDANGVEHQVMVSARGNSRKELCAFPPLRLRFGEDIPEKSTFKGQDKLKLVSHCFTTERKQDYMLKEFAAYRFFALLTNNAYRVRLLQIDYQDTDGKHSLIRHGFVIERTGALAERIGGKRASLKAISKRSLNDQQEALVYVFQYLIGNTDWSMVTSENDDECCHNGKLIRKDHQLLYIPYDFDLSGLVNANYAHPDPSLRIRSVTQRVYRGFCLNPEVLRQAVRTINTRQADFYTIIDELPALTDSNRKKARRFLDRFFKEASDEEKILSSFEKRCLD